MGLLVVYGRITEIILISFSLGLAIFIHTLCNNQVILLVPYLAYPDLQSTFLPHATIKLSALLWGIHENRLQSIKLHTTSPYAIAHHMSTCWAPMKLIDKLHRSNNMLGYILSNTNALQDALVSCGNKAVFGLVVLEHGIQTVRTLFAGSTQPR